MARCALDISHPKFVKLCESDPDLIEGLTVLRSNLAKDHKLCHWVNHPMPKFLQYQNRIWKWDYRPEVTDHSGTRKGWRIYAYVPDPKAPEPIPAAAFFFFDKAKDPGGNHSPWLAGILKKFLAEESALIATEERFRRQTQPDGQIRSLCLSCYESVAVTTDPEERGAAEAAHQCKSN